MRLVSISHWEIARMEKSMPHVVEQIRGTVEARKED
jgi:hypothetical protein